MLGRTKEDIIQTEDVAPLTMDSRLAILYLDCQVQGWREKRVSNPRTQPLETRVDRSGVQMECMRTLLERWHGRIHGQVGNAIMCWVIGRSYTVARTRHVAL